MLSYFFVDLLPQDILRAAYMISPGRTGNYGIAHKVVLNDTADPHRLSRQHPHYRSLIKLFQKEEDVST